ncbi:MAG: RNA polymerase sigma factor [Verrucomicrobiia bacterium]|jgi:RNA polymerase sigma-70 factor (ECF subfamily)
MDEERLITALKAHVPGAAQELVSSYGDRLFRSAFLLCGNEADAEDIVQETFLQAMRSVHRFRGDSTIYTWLHAILLNLTRHYHRDRKRIVCDNELVGREVSPADESPSPLDAGAATSALLKAMCRLSDAHREVLILRYYEDMKIHEIARHLGISTGTVKSRLHYAIGEMQKLLPGELNLFGASGTEEMKPR